MNEIARKALPWATAAVGGIGTAWAARKLLPKKYRDLFGALGLLGGGVAGYYLGNKASDYLFEPSTPQPTSAKAPTEENGAKPAESAVDTALQTESAQNELTPSDVVEYDNALRELTPYTDAELDAMSSAGVDPLDEVTHEWQYPEGDRGDAFRFSDATATGTLRGLSNQLENGFKHSGDLLAFAPGYIPFNIIDAGLDRILPDTDGPVGGEALGASRYVATLGGTALANKIGASILQKIPRLAPLGSLASAANTAVGTTGIAANTIGNVRDALSGKTYKEDTKNIRQDLGAFAKPWQTATHALVNNAIRSGSQAAALHYIAPSSPLTAAMLGAALPIDHPIALAREYGRLIKSHIPDKQRDKENALTLRYLGSHFKDGKLAGLLKLFSSGYWEPEQDKERAQIEREINSNSPTKQQLEFLTKLIRRQNPDLATRAEKGDTDAIRALNRIRAGRL